MQTTVTISCAKCGATNLPMAWTWRPYSHAPGRAWNTSANAKCMMLCSGEDADRSFVRLLKNAGLAMAGEGKRLMTDTEIAEQQNAQTSGHLF